MVGLVSSTNFTGPALAADLAGVCDLQDAELYLTPLGIPSGLPELEVMYGHFTTREVYVNGAETQFTLSDRHLFMEAPRVKWLSSSKDEHAKYALLMVSPDWPERAIDGSMPGALGPRIYWLVLNAKSVASSGYAVFEYDAPAPRSGRHRYIFVLFEQLRPGDIGSFLGRGRDGFDVKGFIRANKEALRPVAINFFYANSTLSDDPLEEDYDSEA